MFAFLFSSINEGPGVSAPDSSKKIRSPRPFEADVGEAIATCGCDVREALRAALISNSYLEAQTERLTEAISTGFARGECGGHPSG
jgi:hypothetical protein